MVAELDAVEAAALAAPFPDPAVAGDRVRALSELSVHLVREARGDGRGGRARTRATPRG